MPTPDVLSDQQLLSLLQAGDHSAFSQLYDRYWAILHRYARRLLQNDDEPADIIQEVFITLWNKAPEMEIRHSLSAFLYTATRNLILKQFAHGKVKEKYLASLAQFANAGVWNADERVRERELTTRIEYEVNQLPSKMREIFLLSKRDFLSPEEISEKLGISTHTVKSQLSNATSKLRVKFGSLFSFVILFL